MASVTPTKKKLAAGEVPIQIQQSLMIAALGKANNYTAGWLTPHGHGSYKYLIPNQNRGA